MKSNRRRFADRKPNNTFLKLILLLLIPASMLTLCGVGAFLGIRAVGDWLRPAGNDEGTAAQSWPKVPPNGRPLVLLVRSAEVTELTPFGQEWDRTIKGPGKKEAGDVRWVPPDLYVRVQLRDAELEKELKAIDEELHKSRPADKKLTQPQTEALARKRKDLYSQIIFETDAVEDRYAANFKDVPAALIGLQVGDRVLLKVYDNDVALDELAGEIEIEITPAMIDKETNLKFGNVLSLKFVIKRR